MSDLIRLTSSDYRRLILQGGYAEDDALALYTGNFAIRGGAVGDGTGQANTGYNEAGDVFQNTVDGIPLQDLWSEFVDTLNMHNADRDAMVSLLSGPETQIVTSFWNGIPDDVEFEEATEYGEPVGIRTPEPKLRGLPMRYYDLAIRYTWRFLAEAEADRIRALHNSALEKDSRLMYQTVLQALFNGNSNRDVLLSNTVSQDGSVQHGSTVTVFGLYNNDGEVPPRWKQYTHDGTHTHYLASGGASVVPGDLEDIEDHLIHHGHRAAGRSLVLMVNRQESKLIQGFRLGTNSAKFDFIPSNQWGQATRDLISGPQAPDKFIGSYGQLLVWEEDSIPAGYMLAYAAAGPNSPLNVVGVREHWNPAVKGLKLIAGNRDAYPLIGSFYQHAVGAGIRDRSGAVVMQVTAGSYTPPTIL